MISAATLTMNEQADLPGCLSSIGWCDDIHVIDSGSQDATVSIAKASGAHIYVNRFESFARQRNWALENCAFRHRWILFLDADECSTPDFHRALAESIVAVPDSIAGFYLCWRMMLDGRWLKRCDSFPKWQFRLLRLGRAKFTDAGHGQKESAVEGEIGYIREPYLHFAFSKGWSRWIDRHNRYSDLEAAERLGARILWGQVFSKHGSVRNKALKPLVSRLPGWPVAAFVIRYILKFGFVEGRAGLVYCINMAYYEFLIVIKMEELRRQRAGSTHGAQSS